jgi:cytochrome c oxidase cbb3-type subunit 3
MPSPDKKLHPLLGPASIGLGLVVIAGWFLLAPQNRSNDVREWTPADHDQPAEQPTEVRGRTDEPDLTEVAWAANCVRCHGPRGMGDGPEGPMARAPDLTRAEWQSRVTDDEIADAVRRGRGKMPAFDLSQSLVAGLVRRIRRHKAAR